MTMTKVEIDVPEEIVPYTVLEDKDAQITRNAMLVYPYIKSVTILRNFTGLDAGESEAIILADEKHSDVLLM